MTADNDTSRKRSEAGRKGGENTLKRHGKEFYQAIGRKGGKSSSKRRHGTASSA